MSLLNHNPLNINMTSVKDSTSADDFKNNTNHIQAHGQSSYHFQTSVSYCPPLFIFLFSCMSVVMSMMFVLSSASLSLSSYSPYYHSHYYNLIGSLRNSRLGTINSGGINNTTTTRILVAPLKQLPATASEGNKLSALKRYDMRKDYSASSFCNALETAFNQGSCPSCFAFALSSLLGIKLCMMRKYDDYNVDQANTTVIDISMPSPYRIFDCAGNRCENTDKGINIMRIIQVMREGVSDISESPRMFGFGCKTLPWPSFIEQEDENGAYDDDENDMRMFSMGNPSPVLFKSTGFHRICGIKWIKRELLVNGPVILFVDLIRDRSRLTHFEEWNELSSPESISEYSTAHQQKQQANNHSINHDNKKTKSSYLKPSKFVSNHALVIIGWDSTPNNIPHWIVKNSWGHEWGDDGVGRVPWKSTTDTNSAISSSSSNLKKGECVFTFDLVLEDATTNDPPNHVSQHWYYSSR